MKNYKVIAADEEIMKAASDAFFRQFVEWMNSESIDNGGWIPISERVPEKTEYMAEAADSEYLRRLEIAVQTDTIEYYIGYFDGYKWFDKRHQDFEDVVAWKIHNPYQPKQETREIYMEERKND